jgi:ankyrin repeat protein
MLAVELLCQWNADASSVDSFGKTPLDYASDEGGGTIIESLVRKLERDLDYHSPSEGENLLKVVDEDRKNNIY